jgi:hypothetical protein
MPVKIALSIKQQFGTSVAKLSVVNEREIRKGVQGIRKEKGFSFVQ